MDKKGNDQDTSTAFGIRDPRELEEERADRIRAAPSHLPQSLQEQINEHRQEREQERESMVKSLEQSFKADVDSAKQNLLKIEGRCDPPWVTKETSALLARDLEQAAEQRVQARNCAQLESFDHFTPWSEIDIVQVYEMSLQSKSVRPDDWHPNLSGKDQDRDRER